MKITNRYASAVHSSNLDVDEKTTYSDSDVLGAMGYAGKAERFDGRPGVPLAAALARLFSGDNTASREIVEIMAELAWSKGKALSVKLTRVQSADMAKAVLAWHRDGVCKPCGGHGYEIVPGTRTVGDTECRACRGSRKMPFDIHFTASEVPIARWLLANLEREQEKAGPAAMAALAPRLEL